MSARARNLCSCCLHSPWIVCAGLLICFLILVLSLVSRLSRLALPRAYRLGEQGIAGGSLEQGKTELESYLADHPDDDYALRLYAVTLLNLGETETGISFLQESLRRNPHQPGVARYLEKIGRPQDVPVCPEAATDEAPPLPHP